MLWCLKNTTGSERGPIYMHRVLNAIHQANGRREPIRLLYGRHNTKVAPYIDFPGHLQNTITKQLLGEYPTLDLEHLPRGTFDMRDGDQVWYVDLHLRPDLYPIQRYTQFEEGPTRDFSDPLTAILEAVAPGPKEKTRAFVEITTRPATKFRKWRARRAIERLTAESFRRSPRLTRMYVNCISYPWASIRLVAWMFGVCFARGEAEPMTAGITASSSRTHEREDDLNAASQKIGSFLFEAQMRLLVCGPLEAEKKALSKLAELRAVVSATANPRLNVFRASRVKRRNAWPRSPRSRGFLLSAEELATLFHPDTNAVSAAKVNRNPSRKLEPPDDLPLVSKEPQIAWLGRVQFRSQNDLFGIRSIDRRRHIYIPGKTGMGKSTLIQNIITSDVHAGKGVCLLDPHGDLATTVARSVPRRRFPDVVLFDPADVQHPIAYNPLAFRHAGQRHLIAGSVLSTFQHIYRDSWGPRMASVFRNALMAAVEMPDPTLITVFQLLTDGAYRNKHLQCVTNPLVKKFWTHKFAGWNDRFRQEVIEPVLNKVESFLTDPTLLRILGQTQNKLDIREIMDDGKILIVNLSKGNLGEDASNLLGSLLISSIQQAAMSRSNIAEEDRRDFYLYVDEFQNFATPSFATILSEGRKYRLNLTIAHQYLGQLDVGSSEDVCLRKAVFGNVGTIVSFAVGNEDAEVIADQLGGGLTPSDLSHLPKYHAYTGLMIDGKTADPFLMATLKPARTLQGERSYDTLITESRNRYATSAAKVDKGLERILALA